LPIPWILLILLILLRLTEIRGQILSLVTVDTGSELVQFKASRKGSAEVKRQGSKLVGASYALGAFCLTSFPRRGGHFFYIQGQEYRIACTISRSDH
jgi:hypothetical protein